MGDFSHANSQLGQQMREVVKPAEQIGGGRKTSKRRSIQDYLEKNREQKFIPAPDE